MKKSGLFILIFTFLVISIFYSVKNQPKTEKTPNSAVISISPTASVSAKPSQTQNEAAKPLFTPTSTPVPTATPTPTPSDKMTMEQVATHNNRNDCYLVIKSNVYDVSSFIPNHPGGQGKITSKCGKEVTGIFASIHSNFAWDLLANYKIGQI